MSRALLIDPFSGASGDMLLSALIDLGVPLERIREALSGVPALSVVKVEQRQVKRGHFRAVQLVVSFPKEKEHRSLSTILEIIDGSNLQDRVKKRAATTFRRLAEVEAKVHGCGVEEVHFHEVGALDAILDILGFHAGLEYLSAEKCYYTNIVLGSGTTHCTHGEIPIPAPATLELLSGHRVIFSARKEELVTPTGAAIIASTFEPLAVNAHVRLDKVGYGAGTREGGSFPNVLRVMLGSVVEMPRHVCIITSTIDDMNPEVYGFVMEKLFSLGALEVYFNPIIMKKSRPGLEITVICEERDVDQISQYVLYHTTTLGLRVNREERIEIPRQTATVRTPYGPIEVKVGLLPDGRKKMSPEFESCRKAAERAGASILDVFDATRSAWEKGAVDE